VFFFSVDEIVLNVDLAPTFLDIGGVATPPHMDGKSFLPLLLHSHRNIKERWPDTFLIESSGRRETPEQLAEAKARAAALRYSAQMNAQHNDTGSKHHDYNIDGRRHQSFEKMLNGSFIKESHLDFGSHEHDDLDDDGNNSHKLVKL